MQEQTKKVRSIAGTNPDGRSYPKQKYNNNKHNLLVFYKRWKYNAIQKNFFLNNRKMTNHPHPPCRNIVQLVARKCKNKVVLFMFKTLSNM